MKTRFHIDVKPVAISFSCPNCQTDTKIEWKEIDVPTYWGDDWGTVECPECGKEIELGEYDYD